MNDLASAMAALIERNGKVELPSSGISMYPLIKEGNVSTFVRVRGEELRIGDICLFETKQGTLVGHRLCAVKQDGDGKWFIFKGDTCFGTDDPVPISNIIGRWAGVSRNNRFLPADHWMSRLLGALALHMPKWSKVIRWFAERKAALHDRSMI